MLSRKRNVYFVFMLLIIGSQSISVWGQDLIVKAINIVSKARYGDEISEAGRIFRNVDRVEDNVKLSQAAEYILKIGLKDEVKNGAYFGLDRDELVLISNANTVRWRSSDYSDAAKYISTQATKNRSQVLKIFVEVDVFLNPEFSAHISKFPQNISIAVVFPNGRLSLTRLVNVNGSVAPLVAWGEKGTLFIHMHNANVIRMFSYINLRKFDVDDIRVVGLFDSNADYRTVQELQQTLSRRGVKGIFSSGPDLNDLMKSAKGRLVFIIGHTEDGKFVVRGSDNSVKFNVSFSDLKEMEEKYKTSVILLGCETGIGGSLTTLHSLEVAKQLDRAFSAPTYGDFFASLGTSDSPFFVSSGQIEHSSMLIARRIGAQEQLQARISIVSVQILRLPAPSLSGRALSFAITLSKYVLIIAFLIFLLFLLIGLISGFIQYVQQMLKK
jgi:hypothetical protein